MYSVLFSFLKIVSGRRSKLNIIKNTLGFQLHDNNTLIIGVRISAEVTAKTWIWKGINFGLLGCLKMTACGGDIVTYRAEMDMELAIQITMVGGKMSIFIKPVHSELHHVNVIVSSLIIVQSELFRQKLLQVGINFSANILGLPTSLVPFLVQRLSKTPRIWYSRRFSREGQ